MSISGNAASTQEVPSDTQEGVTSEDKSLKSWVWPYYCINPNLPKEERTAACVFCQTSIACAPSSGTSALKRHLERCKKSDFYKPPPKKQQKVSESSPVSVVVFDQARCRKALTVMIILDELPFSHVEKEGFRLFCKEMQPSFEIPSRSTITRDCYELFLEEKIKFKQFFSGLSSSVSFTTDLWRSNQNIDYLCLTAHFIDDSWTLHKRIVNFCPIANHTGELIGKTVEMCLLDWGIKKVLTVTVDNATSNDSGVLYLKGKLNCLQKVVLNGDNLHMRCATHILNLIVKEGFKDFNEHISRIRSAVRYVRSSPARTRQFRNCVDIRRMELKGLPSLDVETRWNSTYLMLKSALKFQEAFETLAKVDFKYEHDLDENMPTSVDWLYASSLVPILKVFYDTTVYLSGTSYVTGNEYMSQIYGVGLLLSNLKNEGTCDLALMACTMKKKFDKYWMDFDRMNMFIFIATILDPRYKMAHVSWVIDKMYDVVDGSDLKEKINSSLLALFEVYSPSTSASTSSSTSASLNVLDIRTTSVIGAAAYMNTLYSEEHDDLSRVPNRSELDSYLAEVKADRNDPSFDILSWWRANTSRYPVLSLMARDILAIPVSTVASESAFSTGGRVLDPFRSSLSTRMVEAIICAQDWVRKSHKPLCMEKYIEELENLEPEPDIPLTDEHRIIDIDE